MRITKRILLLFIFLGTSFMAIAEETWSVGEAIIQGKPVVYKFVNDLPEAKVRKKLSWLTVVSWKYDGSKNNGMPPSDVNDEMIRLEDKGVRSSFLTEFYGE